MKLLYHGTRYLRSILTDERLRLPAFGEIHVSLTTRKYVAKYWAEMERDDVFGFGYILSLDWNLLLSDSYIFQPFESPMARIEEHELACNKSIEPIGRYIVKIERVPDSYIGIHELAKIRPAYVEHHYQKLWELDKKSWNSLQRGSSLVEQKVPLAKWKEDGKNSHNHPKYSIEIPAVAT